MRTIVKKITAAENIQNNKIIAHAARVLKNGGLVAFPTETVYGLGADALNAAAVERVFLVKGRAADNPLIVHVADFGEIPPLAADIPETARVLAEAFWPGPMTLVLKKSAALPPETTRGLNTVAVRIPKNPVALALISAAGRPVAAPSANTSGFISPTDARHVRDDLFGKIDFIVDGGPCEVGYESTVIDLTGDGVVILRPGAVTPEMVEQAVKRPVFYLNAAEKRLPPPSPGLKYAHYRPKTKLTLLTGESADVARFINEAARREGAGKVGAAVTDETLPLLNKNVTALAMGGAGRPDAVGKNFYRVLRRQDARNLKIIYAEALDETRGGAAYSIMNRLRKAAAGDIIDAGAFCKNGGALARRPLSVLFVCTGNTCRSPMARVLAEAVFRKRALAIKVDSAGLAAQGGAPASRNAQRAAASRGLDLSGHRAKRLTPQIIAANDLILVMSQSHKNALSAECGGKTFLLSEYASGEASDVRDPFGGDIGEYETVCGRLAELVEQTAEKISRLAQNSGAACPSDVG